MTKVQAPEPLSSELRLRSDHPRSSREVLGNIAAHTPSAGLGTGTGWVYPTLAIPVLPAGVSGLARD
jgi:hypothetical protein